MASSRAFAALAVAMGMGCCGYGLASASTAGTSTITTVAQPATPDAPMTRWQRTAQALTCEQKHDRCVDRCPDTETASGKPSEEWKQCFARCTEKFDC